MTAGLVLNFHRKRADFIVLPLTLSYNLATVNDFNDVKKVGF